MHNHRLVQIKDFGILSVLFLDFDKTLTKNYHNKAKLSGTFGLFDIVILFLD